MTFVIRSSSNSQWPCLGWNVQGGLKCSRRGYCRLHLSSFCWSERWALFMVFGCSFGFYQIARCGRPAKIMKGILSGTRACASFSRASFTSIGKQGMSIADHGILSLNIRLKIYWAYLDEHFVWPKPMVALPWLFPQVCSFDIALRIPPGTKTSRWVARAPQPSPSSRPDHRSQLNPKSLKHISLLCPKKSREVKRKLLEKCLVL